MLMTLLTQHPDLSEPPTAKPRQKTIAGYKKISRHYKWALSQVFDVLNYESVIIVEDDLDISPVRITAPPLKHPYPHPPHRTSSSTLAPPRP